jgi:hypothetical protein
MKKRLSEMSWGEKWKDVTRMFILLLPKATKMEHFKGHQTWNIPRATKLRTFHRPPSCGFPLPFSFLLFLKAQI